MKTVILMYHSIVDAGKKGKDFYCVDVERFKAQMHYLRYAQGIAVTPFDAKTDQMHRCRILLTFDDGHVSNYTLAYPLLKAYGFSASFFIIVSRVGKPGYMSWSHIQEVAQSGITIGSHGMTHRIFTGLSDEELEVELKESKMILEEKLNRKIHSVSIPRGFCDERVLTKAYNAGYREVFTSDFGTNADNALHLERLCRIPVRNTLSLGRFQRIVQGKATVKETAGHYIKRCFAACIGIKQYEKITKRFYKWT